MPLNITLTETGTSKVPVLGISEWMCYYANYDRPCGKATDIDECIDLHLAVGIDQVVWNLGRSVVDYWSELPHVTRMCELSDQVGPKQWSFVREVMRQVCPLRRALEYGRQRDVTILGRLCMNRHYGTSDYAGVTSRMARDNPHLHERSKLGSPVPTRLCYALDQVQQERIDILLEAQRIGVDGLVLDFCRQMPILMYHQALVQPYISAKGADPRSIDSDDPDEYRDWFQYRADVLTGFMTKLRQQVRRQEGTLGRPCPIVARVPDSAPWLMIAYGLDTERWCAEDLVDGIMLSPFPITVEALALYPEYHIETAHRHGKMCIGGIGSRNLIQNAVHKNTGFFHPQPVYALADRQYRAGADAISLYQSETLVRMDYLAPTIRALGDRELVARRADELAVPELSEGDPIGMDWHTHMQGTYSLRTQIAGDRAL